MPARVVGDPLQEAAELRLPHLGRRVLGHGAEIGLEQRGGIQERFGAVELALPERVVGAELAQEHLPAMAECVGPAEAELAERGVRLRQESGRPGPGRRVLEQRLGRYAAVRPVLLVPDRQAVPAMPGKPYQSGAATLPNGSRAFLMCQILLRSPPTARSPFSSMHRSATYSSPASSNAMERCA